MQPRKSTVLYMNKLNQIKSPIFVILCVLFFHRQSFWTYIKCIWNQYDVFFFIAECGIHWGSITLIMGILVQ